MREKEIRAVFFDIDGTLVSFKTHSMPSSTKEALEKLRARGIKMFIATGRSPLLVDNVDKSMFDGIIGLNGQYCEVDGEIVHSHFIPAGDVRGAKSFLRKHNVAALFEAPDKLSLNLTNDMVDEGARLVDIRMPDPTHIDDIDDNNILQLIFFGGPEYESELLEAMPSCVATRWTPLLSDIIPRGGGKHVGVEKILAHFGIAREECMAFGDGENDITMLQYAGTGIAMGNAAPIVKQAADYVTTSVDSNGISKALKYYRLIK